MFFHVDPHSDLPIYVQIINQVKHAVASQVLQAGDKLPSVRQLAKDLVVNPNTVARSYKELESEDVIETVKGRGTFVAETQTTLVMAERLKQLRRLSHRLLVEAYHLDVDFDTVIELVKQEVSEFSFGGEGEDNAGN